MWISITDFNMHEQEFGLLQRKLLSPKTSKRKKEKEKEDPVLLLFPSRVQVSGLEGQATHVIAFKKHCFMCTEQKIHDANS